MTIRNLPLGAFLTRGMAFALLWWVLVDGRTEAWGLGAVGTVAATAASLRLLPSGQRHIEFVALVRFLAFFLWNSLHGGMQVAVMALRGRVGLYPAILEIFLNLPPGAPRFLLLNACTLMPGTLSVRLTDDGKLRVHVLDARLPVVAEVRALEAHIARLFGVTHGGTAGGPS